MYHTWKPCYLNHTDKEYASDCKGTYYIEHSAVSFSHTSKVAAGEPTTKTVDHRDFAIPVLNPTVNPPPGYIIICPPKNIQLYTTSTPNTGKKWNFLLKHSTGNVQEISIDIYCSKTVVISYLGNFKCQGYFLASTEILNFMHFFYIQNA